MSRALLTALALTLIAPAAEAHDFVDSRITATFGDDDLLSDAGEKISNSALIGFGDRPGYELFYDNLNTRYSSRETLTHLVFYRKLPSFFDNVTTEAAVVLLAQFNLNAPGVTLRDTGSYIRVTYNPWDDPDDGLKLTLFPFDSDRFRLGYLYDLSLGGIEMFARTAWYGSPAARLRLDHGRGFGFVGVKALPLEGPATIDGLDRTVNETHYAVLGGLGWDLAEDRLRVEAAAAYIEQADNPISDVRGEATYTVGGAARVVFHLDLPIEDSLDQALYRNDPNRPFIAFEPVRYTRDQLGLLASLEGIVLTQRLADPDAHGGTTHQPAFAAALRLRLQRDYLRTGLTVLLRSFSFLQVNTPGFVPFTALGGGAEAKPEIFASAAADYHFPALHLTVGASVGIQIPASLRTELYAHTGANTAPTLIGEALMVLGPNGERVILPQGESVDPNVATRLQARLDLSELLYTLLWVQYRHNGNNSVLNINPDLTKSRVEESGHAFGLGVTAAVRL
jgi:hypothetical protein